MEGDTIITRSIATMSWIDPKTGLLEVDHGGNPGQQVGRSIIVGCKAYRFANFLEARIYVGKDGRIRFEEFTEDSAMYRNLSYRGIPSEPYDTRQFIRNQIDAEANCEGRNFIQLVGCRTQSPEVIGERVGATVGKIGGHPGSFFGGGIGRLSAEKILVFPPIWTELELTIYTNGFSKGRILRHSMFPSVTCYVQTPRVSTGITLQNDRRKAPQYVVDSVLYQKSYEMNAVPYIDLWKEKGWGSTADTVTQIWTGISGPVLGNPWNIHHP